MTIKYLVLLAVSLCLASATPTSSSSGSSDLQLAMTLATQLMKNEDLQARAMDQALQMIAPTVHNIQKRAIEAIGPQARALIPVEFSLAGLTLFGTFKLAVMLVGAIFWATTLIPAVFSFLGITVPPLPFRSLSDEFSKLNYEVIARSIDTIHQKSHLLDLKEEQCKEKVICEVGEFVGARYPSVRFYLKKLGSFDKLILGDQYVLAMVKGMNHSNCTHVYSKCSRSPLAVLNEIVDTFR